MHEIEFKTKINSFIRFHEIADANYFFYSLFIRYILKYCIAFVGHSNILLF